MTNTNADTGPIPTPEESDAARIYEIIQDPVDFAQKKDQIEKRVKENPKLAKALGNYFFNHVSFYPGDDCVGTVVPRHYQQLCAVGANPNVYRDGVYSTPLIIAAANGTLDALNALLAAGADMNCRSHAWQMTPLMKAAEYGHPNCVLALLKAGADIDAQAQPEEWLQTDPGCTAAMLAVGTAEAYAARFEENENWLECLRILVKAGANLELRTKEGRTVFSLAGHNRDILDILNSSPQTHTHCEWIPPTWYYRKASMISVEGISSVNPKHLSGHNDRTGSNLNLTMG